MLSYASRMEVEVMVMVKVQVHPHLGAATGQQLKTMSTGQNIRGHELSKKNISWVMQLLLKYSNLTYI